MKRALVLALFVAACDPMGDFDIDLSGLEPGPIAGDRGAVTFALVDGCPGGNFLFGCDKTMPAFAVGARARFVIGSASGSPSDEAKLAKATFVVSDPRVAAVGRDAEGFVVLSALADGSAVIEVDDENGDVIDSISVDVERVVSLKGDMATTVLEGARLGASVIATGTSGRALFAHGAVVATLTGGIELDADPSGFFMSSEQVVIRVGKLLPPDTNSETEPTESIARTRPAHIVWSTGAVSTDVSYTIVTRDDITSVKVSELWHEPSAYKQNLHADAKVGEKYVRGGPACDWRIVSGGGDGAALASGVGDDTHSGFAFFDSALVYGNGDMTVECRVNERVVGEMTVHLGP
ncbi:MAG TPA: hypothetical protein VMZ53_25445 [Kofleriaceae bacterium]|nr:hypothetical protein [Kofleriaceae bacterium]